MIAEYDSLLSKVGAEAVQRESATDREAQQGGELARWNREVVEATQAAEVGVREQSFGRVPQQRRDVGGAEEQPDVGARLDSDSNLVQPEGTAGHQLSEDQLEIKCS